MRWRMINEDCRSAMRTMPPNIFDVIITDPPYEIGFNGQKWDSTGVAYDPRTWEGALRVAKPGAYMLVFGGTRTFHRVACVIEDAGWNIRDCMMWVYSSGFPKSQNIGKKVEGWDGWGSALKPAYEPIIIAQKPLIGSLVANVKRFGVGGLNIDAARVPANDGFEKIWDKPISTNVGANGKGNYISDGSQHTLDLSANKPKGGRWPANLLHDGSEEVTRLMPEDEHGSAARFFWCPKANKKDRGKGNTHNTVKPTALMRYLVKLTTPPGAMVLDMFAGSGSTGRAALLEGARFMGIEKDKGNCEICRTRLGRIANP
jgi:DNA modification methylase